MGRALPIRQRVSPLCRICMPSSAWPNRRIARSALYLASDASSFTTVDLTPIDPDTLSRLGL